MFKLLQRWCRLSIWVVVLMMMAGFDSHAASVIELDADRQYDYARHCYSTGDFFRSVQEFERFVYFFPEDGRVEQARYQIGMSYFNGNRFRDAIKAFEELIRTFENTDLSIRSYVMLGRCHELLHDPGQAVIVLQNLLALFEDPIVRDEAHYRIGWIYLQTGDWEKARRHFDLISPAAADTYRLKRLSSELGKSSQIKQKNPHLAGVLSVIPGAGFAYCERYYDAITAFLLNAGLIFAAFEAFDDENYGLGGVISFVELGFYGGNIYGAVSSAHKYNQAQDRRFIETIKETAGITLGAVPGSRNVAFSFNCRF